MNKSGTHHNLPSILRRPSSSNSCINSRGQVAPTDESDSSAKNSAVRSHQQAVSLFTEVHGENLKQATHSESSDYCDASAVIKGCGAEGLGIILEECKENSLPPVSFQCLDFQPQHSVPETSITSNGNTGSTQTVSVSGNMYTVASLDSTIKSVLGFNKATVVPPQPLNIRIHSVPIYQIVPTQPNLAGTISPTVASSSNTETVTAQSLNSPGRPPVHKKSTSDFQDASPSERVPSECQSPPTSLERIRTKQSSTKTQQYQCPKCLLRFGSILNQLQHKCNPERTSGGSLHNRRSLKLYKCLECCEEFSDLEDKIRHTCSAWMGNEPNSMGPVPDNPHPNRQSMTEVGKRSERLDTNWQHTPNGTVVCSMCNMELANNKHDMKLHMTINHMENKSKGRAFTDKMCFRCLTCCKTFASNLKLKQHRLAKHCQKNLNVGACEEVCEKSSSSSPVRVNAETACHGSKYDKQFKCGMCSIKYQHVGHLKNHIAAHMGSDEYKRGKFPYVCRLCKARFQWSKQLKKHAAKKCCLKKNHKEVNQNVNRSSQLRHESVNCSSTINTSIPSDVSQASPTPEASTSIQQSYNTGPRIQLYVQKCGFCSLICDSATTLRKHVRTHWNEIFEKPSNSLICSRCSEEFDSCVKLFLHVRRNCCTSASDDTSQSCDSDVRNEGEAPENIDEPEGSSSRNGDDTCKDGKYYCPHCSLIFWSAQILGIHLQSSHPLLLDKEETAVSKSNKEGAESSNGLLEEVVQPRESLDPVLPTRGQINMPDDGKACMLSEQSSAHQDSADIEDTDVSRRTQIYPCRCNMCKLDFTIWRHLDEHRWACHPRKARLLQLQASQLSTPDESIDEPLVEVICTDYFHPCDLCDMVFSSGRTLALHKKVKHHLRFMFARYSSPRKLLNREIVKPSETDFQISKSTKDPVSSKQFNIMAHASVLDTHEDQRLEATHVQETERSINQANNDRLACSVKIPGEKYKHQYIPSHIPSQQPLTSVCFETETESSVNSDNQNQSVQNLSASDGMDQSYKEDIRQTSVLNPPAEPKRTVEDLKISSVVSLYKGGPDIVTWQRTESAVETTDHPQTLSEKSNWQQISKEMSLNVKGSLPVQTGEDLECPLIIPRDEMLSPSPQTSKEQQATRDTFNCLLDSVLALESSIHTNSFRPVSVADDVTSAGRDTLSPNQTGWHGTKKKISLSEAKQILKVIERNPISDCYHCSVCGDWFQFIRNYTSHILAHCNSELYQCSICEVKSSNIFSVINHVINTHDLTCDAFPELVQTRSLLEAGGVINQPVHDDVPESFISSEAPVDLDCIGLVQQTEITYPRPLYDYIHKPMDLEIKLQFNIQKGAYVCPICPYRNKAKAGLIYHLRMHHKQRPYKCRHCNQRFSFFPDIQVHFFKYHKHVMQADQQQARQTFENQNLLLGSQFMNQIGNNSSSGCQSVHSEVLNEITGPGQGETKSTVFQHCLDTDKVSVFQPFCVSTTMEQQHQTSNSDPDDGALSTNLELQQISSNGEKFPSFLKVKQKRLPDDDADNSSCMVKEGTLNFIKTEAVSFDAITVKTEHSEECIYQGAEWVEHADSEFTHFQDHSTGVSGEKEQSCVSGVVVVPSASSGSELPNEMSSCSDVIASPKPLEKDSCCIEPAESEPSDVISSTENKITSPSVDPDYPNCPEAVTPHSVIAKECNVFHHDHSNPPVDVGIYESITESGVCSPCVETQVQPCRMQMMADTASSDDKATGNDKVGHEDLGFVHTDSDKVSLGDEASFEDAMRVDTLTLPEISGIGSRTAAEEQSDSSVQPLDDLFQLASDIGITVTGSNILEVSAGEATSALQQSSYWDAQSGPDVLLVGTTGDENPGAISVTDRDDIVQPIVMASSDNIISSPTPQLYSINDSDVLQDDASPECNNKAPDARDIETNVRIMEELVKQTSANVLSKRACEENADSQDATKRQKLSTPIEENFPIQNKPSQEIPSIRIKQECESLSFDECREKDSLNVYCKETSNGCFSHQVDEDQRESSPLNGSDIGVDAAISQILEDVAKNCFTSKILESFQRESEESISYQNSLDLDLNGPPFVGLSVGALDEAVGQEDIPLSKNRQNNSLVESGLSKNKNLKPAGDNTSGMPIIFDVAGNGQMPEIPCGREPEDWDNISLMLPSQDEQCNVAVTDYLDGRESGTNNSRHLKDPNYIVRHVKYKGISPAPDPVDNNHNLKALLSNTSHELYICPDETSFSKPASEVLSSPCSSDAQNGDASSSIGPWDVQESHKKHARSQQCRDHSFGMKDTRRYSCEESWIRQYLEPELVSPQSGCELPTLVHHKVGSLAQQYQKCPGVKRNSGGQFQDDSDQESQLTLSQMASLSPTYEHSSSCMHQQHYQDSQLGRNSWSGQSPKHLTQESSTRYFKASKNHLAALKTMQKAGAATHLSCHSLGQCRTFNYQQDIVSPDPSNQSHALNGGHKALYRDRNNVTSYSRNNSMELNFELSDAFLKETTPGIRAQPNQWSAGSVPQQQNEAVHSTGNSYNGPSWNPSSQSRWPQLMNRHVPSASCQAESGGIYRYHRVNKPVSTVRSVLREQLESEQRKVHKTSPDSIQWLPPSVSRSRYPLNRSQEDTSQCLPQIVSVASLHPRYLQRTHSV